MATVQHNGRAETESPLPTPAPQDELDKSPLRLQRIFVINLLGILALGTLVSGWILYYTEWFPAIGGLLALGGVLSWLAFISRVLPEERLAALQTWADQRILSSHATLVILAVLAGGALIAATFLGSIQVTATRESTDRFVQIYRTGRTPTLEARLPAGGRVRKPVWTAWLRPTSWRVKVSGYPDEAVTVRPWRRAALSVPASFRRPVVVVRSTIDLFDIVHNRPRTLTIAVGDRTFKTQFNGHALWLGCDEDVEIPPALDAAWRAEANARARPSVITYWLHPASIAADAKLSPGTRIAATLLDQAGRPVTTELLVRKDEIPQEMILDLPR